MEPVVTVITATKNLIENGKAEDFALLCTLLELQSFPRIEHLVIDGDSTDGTKKILKNYKNRGLIEYISEPDISKFDAYNKGIKKAKGKYVTFLSADDFYHDITAFEDIVNQMDNEDAVFTFSPSYCRHPLGTVFMFMPSMHNAFQVVPCPRQCMVFNKTYLQIEKGFDTKFKYMADFDLVIRLMMKKYKPLYLHRNFVTYKLGTTLYQSPELGEFEAGEIFKKNYGKLCQLDDQLIENMVKKSAFPQELLDKLVKKFPDEDKELFYERCEQMRLMRTEAVEKRNNS